MTTDYPHYESFYVSPHHVTENKIVLADEEVHHLARVKRHKIGDIIWAVDGMGVMYEAELVFVSKTRAEGRIIRIRRRVGEPVMELTLAQAMIKGERFDWLVEKSVEIGVHRLIPLITEKTMVRAGSGKLERWSRIALGAMKQCGRSRLTEITEPKILKQVCALGADCSFRFIAHAGCSRPVEISRSAGLLPIKGICLVGPEGGFTDGEIGMAEDNGFMPVSLGPRRLRSETAGIVLSSIILSQSGELC